MKDGKIEKGESIMPRKKETRGRKPLPLTPKKKEQHHREKNYEWKKENTRCINVRFNNVTDADVLARIDEVPNKADYIRKLIRADIEKGE